MVNGEKSLFLFLSLDVNSTYMIIFSQQMQSPCQHTTHKTERFGCLSNFPGVRLKEIEQ